MLTRCHHSKTYWKKTFKTLRPIRHKILPHKSCLISLWGSKPALTSLILARQVHTKDWETERSSLSILKFSLLILSHDSKAIMSKQHHRGQFWACLAELQINLVPLLTYSRKADITVGDVCICRFPPAISIQWHLDTVAWNAC